MTKERSAAWYQRGLAAQQAGDTAAAVQAWNQALRDDPRNFEAVLQLAESWLAAGQPGTAVSLYREALRLAPDNPRLLTAFAQCQEDRGAFDEARALYGRAVEQGGDQAYALGQLLSLDDGQTADALISDAEKFLRSEAPARSRALVGYGLGKLHNARQEHAAAMAAWSAANAARRADAGPLDRAALKKRVDELLRVFDAEHFARVAGWTQRPEQPIFIVGMPRSGTTLVEQILSRHALVDARGESPAMATIAQQMPAMAASVQRWPQALPEVNQEAALEASDLYLQKIQARRGRRTTDKAPLNIYHVGLIKTLFPSARVLLCLRDPRDVLLSIFEQNFAPNQRFATDWADLAFYYAQFLRLAQHWQALPGVLAGTLRYEALVQNPEPETRQLLEQLDLPWEAACLEPEKATRAVMTPSKWQVRQPLYGSSAGRWRHYEPWLAPLLEALAAFGVKLDGPD